MDVKPVIVKGIKVSGLSVQLTRSQSQNHQIIAKHWQTFNHILKSKKLKLGRNWVKYGITQKVGDSYYYMTAIPSDIGVGGFDGFEVDGGEIDGFETVILDTAEYCCFQHMGSMGLIKSTIYKIYKEIIPSLGIRLNENRGLIHYERYDYRFNWNKPNSIIDIYVPTKSNT